MTPLPGPGLLHCVMVAGVIVGNILGMQYVLCMLSETRAAWVSLSMIEAEREKAERRATSLASVTSVMMRG